MAQSSDHSGCPEDQESSLLSDIERFREEFEVEIAASEETLESDLSLRKMNCAKNEGHKEFIAVNDLALEHLPPEWRVPWVYELIKKLSRRVVHLKVTYTSKVRPDGYPDHKWRGSRRIRVGTGWAAITEEDLKKSPQPCSIPNCKVKGHHFVTPEFWVDTAAHVVFDTSEALCTTVSFFKDSDADSDKGTVVEARGLRTLEFVGAVSDINRIACVSHDLDLFAKVLSCPGQSQPWPKLEQKGREPLVVVPSHPHGLSKQICVGQWIGCSKFKLTAVPCYFNRPEAFEPFWSSVGVDPKDIKMNTEQYIDRLSSFGVTEEMIAGIPEVVDILKRGCVGKRWFDGLFDSDEIKQVVDRLQQLKSSSLLHYLHMLYSTPTCPGSSGAPVFVFGEEENGRLFCSSLCHHSRARGKLNASSEIVEESILARFQAFYEKLCRDNKVKIKKTTVFDDAVDEQMCHHLAGPMARLFWEEISKREKSSHTPTATSVPSPVFAKSGVKSSAKDKFSPTPTASSVPLQASAGTGVKSSIKDKLPHTPSASSVPIQASAETGVKSSIKDKLSASSVPIQVSAETGVKSSTEDKSPHISTVPSVPSQISAEARVKASLKDILFPPAPSFPAPNFERLHYLGRSPQPGPEPRPRHDQAELRSHGQLDRVLTVHRIMRAHLHSQ